MSYRNEAMEQNNNTQKKDCPSSHTTCPASVMPVFLTLTSHDAVPLHLALVAVYAGDGVAVAAHAVRQVVGHGLGAREDQRLALRRLFYLVQNLLQPKAAIDTHNGDKCGQRRYFVKL